MFEPIFPGATIPIRSVILGQSDPRDPEYWRKALERFKEDKKELEEFYGPRSPEQEKLLEYYRDMIPRVESFLQTGWWPPFPGTPGRSKALPGGGVLMLPPFESLTAPETPPPPPPPLPVPSGGITRRGIIDRPDVATTMCPQGQFWDGQRCRGSVSSFGAFGGLALQPGGGATTFTMGSIPLVRGIGTRALGL